MDRSVAVAGDGGKKKREEDRSGSVEITLDGGRQRQSPGGLRRQVW